MAQVIKISKNTDVEKISDDDLLFSSKYLCFKVIKEIEKIFSLIPLEEQGGTMYASDNYTTEIKHGLKFVPGFLVAYKLPTVNYWYFTQGYNPDSEYSHHVDVSTDKNNIYFYFLGGTACGPGDLKVKFILLGDKANE
jgi:hypothetical protein